MRDAGGDRQHDRHAADERRERRRRLAHLLRLDREHDEVGAVDRARASCVAEERRRRESAPRASSRCSAKGSTTRKPRAARAWATRPPMSAVAMLPPPMKVMFMAASALRASRQIRPRTACASRSPSAARSASCSRAFTRARRRSRCRRAPRVAPSAIAASRSRRHAHRQRVDGKPRGAARVEARAQRAELRALPRDVRGRLGDAHDAAQGAAAAARRPPARAPAPRRARRRSSTPRR